jgi:hypothetical protein
MLGDSGYRCSTVSAVLALGVALLLSPRAVAGCGDHVLLLPHGTVVQPLTGDGTPTPVPRPCSGPECSGRQAPATASAPAASPEFRGQAALGGQPTPDEPCHPCRRGPCEPDTRNPAPDPDPIYHPPR